MKSLKPIFFFTILLLLVLGCKAIIFFSPTYSPKRTIVIQKNIKYDSLKQNKKPAK